MTVNEPGDQTKYIAKLADLVELVEEHNLWDLIDMPKLFEAARSAGVDLGAEE